MGKYVNEHLNRNEEVKSNAELNKLFIVWPIVYGVLFCWLIVPTIVAVIRIIQFFCVELSVTDKRVIGKNGVIATKSLDAPLNKIQNVSVSSNLWGKLFNYGTVVITTASGTFYYKGIKEADVFKNRVLDQIDQYEHDIIKAQATEMARAMRGTEM